MLVEVTSDAEIIKVPSCPAKLFLMATSGGYCPDYTPLRAPAYAEFLGCTQSPFSLLENVKGTSQIDVAGAISVIRLGAQPAPSRLATRSPSPASRLCLWGLWERRRPTGLFAFDVVFEVAFVTAAFRRAVLDLAVGPGHAVPPLAAPHPHNVAPGNHLHALILTPPAFLTTLVMCPRANSKSVKSGKRKTPAIPTWLLRCTTKP